MIVSKPTLKGFSMVSNLLASKTCSTVSNLSPSPFRSVPTTPWRDSITLKATRLPSISKLFKAAKPTLVGVLVEISKTCSTTSVASVSPFRSIAPWADSDTMKATRLPSITSGVVAKPTLRGFSMVSGALASKTCSTLSTLSLSPFRSVPGGGPTRGSNTTKAARLPSIRRLIGDTPTLVIVPVEKSKRCSTKSDLSPSPFRSVPPTPSLNSDTNKNRRLPSIEPKPAKPILVIVLWASASCIAITIALIPITTATKTIAGITHALIAIVYSIKLLKDDQTLISSYFFDMIK